MFRLPYKKLSAQERLRLHLAATFDPPMSPQEAKERYLPPPEGTSYEYGEEDHIHTPRVTTGPLLNAKGEPAALDEKKLAVQRETIRNLQFPNPDDFVGPPRPEAPEDRVRRLQREAAESSHATCGNVVERGVGHTGNFVCLVYIGAGGDWDPPKP